MARNAMKLLGDKELERTFKTLGERVQRKVLRQAVNTAATPVVKAARAKAPKDSGLLKKSLGKKLVTNKKAGVVTAVVGPRRNVVGEHDGKPRKPSRYAHLVEKGHIDGDGNHVPAQPFLRPAMEETEAQALGVMTDKLAAGVVREASKGAQGA